jgi:N-acetylmuramoyl-L-alanine amidase
VTTSALRWAIILTVLATAFAPAATLGGGGAATAARSTARQTSAKRKKVVVIDAGHQAKADSRLEPIGPGSKKRKARVSSGTSGVSTHNRESAINLAIALKLRSALRKRGVTVVMIRTKQNVNISNAKRAKIGNAAHADLVIRLHCDGSTNHSVKGLLTLVPAKNKWTGRIVKKSGRAGKDVQAATLKTTKAHNRGVVSRGDLTGFNWSKVPSVLVEMGLMSNPSEDRKLASKGYQAKLVAGMTNGVMRFLSGK